MIYFAYIYNISSKEKSRSIIYKYNIFITHKAVNVTALKIPFEIVHLVFKIKSILPAIPNVLFVLVVLYLLDLLKSL